MFRLCLFFLLATCVCLEGKTTSITVEYAISRAEKAWGLMQRNELPENHGMLFVYSYPKKASVWMFNCFMDLSVAFLDEEGIIQEIRELTAYPKMMDPNRSVKTIGDVSLYPRKDPITVFFHQKRVTSSFRSSYSLEMGKNWFKDHEIRVGDKVLFTPPIPSAYITN